MSLPRYPKYKDSGVAWLGEVPEQWQVRRLKHVCRAVPSNVDKKSHEGEQPVVLCNYTDVYYNDRITADLEFMPATASPEQIEKFSLKAGDTLITKDSETADDIAVSSYVPADLPGVVCGYHLSIVRPLAGANGAFVKWLFDSHYSKATVAVRANGLTRVGLSQYDIDNIEWPWPPIAEQEAVSSFLDRETAKIDALIAEQQRLIELLNEKRQVVISRAVTKGLHPDAARKLSGVQSIGEIPAHWRITKLAHLLAERPKNGISPEVTTNGTVPTFSTAAVRNGIVNISDHLKYVSLDSNDVRAYSVKQGDVLVLRGSGSKDLVGSAGIVWDVPPSNCIYPDILIRIRPGALISPWYLVTCLNSSALRPEIEMAAVTAAGIWKISGGSLAEVRLPCPPLHEQREIESYLRSNLSATGGLIGNAEQAVGLLNERRASMISAAVTGQIDVRQHARANVR